MFSHVCVAGTFDGLHSGHQKLLEAAFTNGAYVTVAVTSDAFVDKYKGDKMVSPFTSRKKGITSWLSHKRWSKRSTIVSIDDDIGSADTSDFDALIVTSQNRITGERINKLRKQNKKPPLMLIEVSLVDAQDKEPISSTRLRKGEIDATGRLVMPDSMREELSQPLGRVLVNSHMIEESLETYKDAIMVSVGDMTTKAFVDRGVVPHLVIVDGKVNRKEFFELTSWLSKHKRQTKHFMSGPGFISHSASDAIQAWSAKPKQSNIFVIDGEEDLLVLPAALYAPVGSLVYYGQPPVAAWACGPETTGIVEVVVTQSIKEAVSTLLQKFIK